MCLRRGRARRGSRHVRAAHASHPRSPPSATVSDSSGGGGDGGGGNGGKAEADTAAAATAADLAAVAAERLEETAGPRGPIAWRIGRRRRRRRRRGRLLWWRCGRVWRSHLGVAAAIAIAAKQAQPRARKVAKESPHVKRRCRSCRTPVVVLAVAGRGRAAGERVVAVRMGERREKETPAVVGLEEVERRRQAWRRGWCLWVSDRDGRRKDGKRRRRRWRAVALMAARAQPWRTRLSAQILHPRDKAAAGAIPVGPARSRGSSRAAVW